MELFFSKVIKGISDNKLAIIEILKARGFLIEEVNGDYYLSDNADAKDVQYLSELFDKYQLGTITDKNAYIARRRRDWYSFSKSAYTPYEAIESKKVRLNINDMIRIEDAVNIFRDYKRVYSGQPEQFHNWEQIKEEKMGKKPLVSQLEPYVALYVKAISACGVYAWSSCDGNHPKDGGVVFVYAEYPSDIWHESLWGNIIQIKYGSIPFIGEGIPFDQNNQEEIYILVHDIATFLYANRIEIRKLKAESVGFITKDYIEEHTDEEIMCTYKEKCDEVLKKSDLRRRIESEAVIAE